MILASTFLSHNGANKALVLAVARELGRRGIIAWVDVNEMGVGDDLDVALAEAVKRQATLTLFLSEEAIASDWVMKELKIALKHKSANIFPVYLGTPVDLIRKCDPLNPDWLTPDSRAAKIIGAKIDPLAEVNASAKTIADAVAKSIYTRLDFAGSTEAIIDLDQRGGGARKGGSINIPSNAESLNAPTLVFRPSLEMRTNDETIFGDAWNEIRETMLTALSHAFGTFRNTKEIYIYGHAQLAFPFLLGKYFDRTTAAHLFCYNSRDKRTFDNQKQERFTPLAGGNENCESSHKDVKPLVSGDVHPVISLVFAKQPRLEDVLKYCAAQPDAPPVVWVTTSLYDNSDQVMDRIKDVVALLERLKRENKVETIFLYTDFPFHALPLLAANLRYVVRNVVFMEYRKDLEGHSPKASEFYVPLKMG